MESLMFFIAFVTFIAFVVGMFSPKTVKCTSRGKVALIYLTLFFFCCMIGSLLSEDVETTAMENENVSTENVNTKKENEDQKLGKIIKVGNFAYTVDGFEFRKSIGDQYYSKTADGVYLLIAISITNNGNETKTIDNSLFNLTGVNGSKYEYSTDGSVALEMAGAKTLFLKQCQPGITTQGILIFEVPEQDSYYLHLTGGYLSNKSKKVLLK